MCYAQVQVRIHNFTEKNNQGLLIKHVYTFNSVLLMEWTITN